MTVAIGAMKHESNTFTSLRTSLDDFDPVVGDVVFDTPRWANGSATAGIVDALAARDVDVTPTCFGKALPSGIVEADAYRWMKSKIVEGIHETEPDGVCLDLHGSMYAEDEPDPEGDLLAAVRSAVGDDVPIVCSLDMHTTLTARMVDAADGFTAYRTAPHTDVYETGVRAGALLATLLEGEESTVEWVRLPMLLAGEQSETDAQPMADLVAALDAADERPGVLSTDFLLGFPWADSPHGGVFVLGVGAGGADAELRRTIEALASEFWARRHEFDFTTEAYPLEQALDEAVGGGPEGDEATRDGPERDEATHDVHGPVVVADSGDNPTAGATEDLTIVTERLLDRGIDDALVAVIADADARAACEAAGEGGAVSLELGRTGAATDAPPLSVDARVVTLETVGDVDAAVIEVAGVTVVVTDRRVSVTDPAFLESLDCDPRDFSIVVVKSGYLSPAYQALASQQLLALTPGDTNEILADLPYEAVSRPIYPLDPETSWSPGDP